MTQSNLTRAPLTDTTDVTSAFTQYLGDAASPAVAAGSHSVEAGQTEAAHASSTDNSRPIELLAFAMTEQPSARLT